MALRIGLLLALLLLLVALPWITAATGQTFILKMVTRILILGLAAAALDLVLGYGGMVSFGHGAFLGIGGYVVGILFQHAFEGTTIFGLEPSQSILLQIPLAMLLSALFALVTGAICLRTEGVAFIMITLAFAQMLFFLMISLDIYGGDNGIALWNRSAGPGPIDLERDGSFYLLCLGALLLFLFLARRLTRARFGRVLVGSAANERRMRALGFATFRYRLAAYALSGAFTGLAGLLLANHHLYVSPAVMNWQSSGHLIVMVVLGGMGTLIGPVLGAALFILLESFLPRALALAGPGLADHWQLLLGPLLVLMALYARTGLLGLLTAGRRNG